MKQQLFEELEKMNTRPEPFEFYTASDLWTDDHRSKQMLGFHLNEDIDVSSRKMEFIQRSVEWITTRFNIGAGTKIADFGCGPGLYANKLAKKQTEVTGIDFSERSIQYARGVAVKEGLSVHYIKQNYQEFESDEPFDLLLMIMCDFCALSPRQRNKMLEKFYSLLKPGGFVLLDVYSLNAFEQKKETAQYEFNLLDGFWSPDSYYGFLNVFKYEAEKVTLDKYTIFEATRTYPVYNWLQYFTPESLEREFVNCGFTIEGFYSDVAGTAYNSKSNEFAVVAKKGK
jgi:SAM-dependent methyltransferase